ncbi:hypothetical protein [Flavobacterium oreochromis]|uniref:Uncharacterized protein n=1 Tax=Flavobacterium columnare TaxID=996 RepID=A0A246GC14_9FLAO|nr:hypothetical protein [Flavobacterium oreochromis]OWP78445.1 hypothetical protein BWK62_05225 [Flavobacterium oreochromis]
MEILDRSAIIIKPKQPYFDWVKSLDQETSAMEISMLEKPRTYLTDSVLKDEEKHLKKYFKQVFEEELESVLTNQEDWPQKRDIKTFYEWFDVEISDWVQDLSKKSLFNLLSQRKTLIKYFIQQF